MNSSKFLQLTIGLILIIVLVAWRTSGSLFTHVKTVKVTPVPAAKLLRGSFVRIFHVPGNNRIIVTFNTNTSMTAAGKYEDLAYAYREYKADMVATGFANVILWANPNHPFTDTGALLVGNDLYLATQNVEDTVSNIEGWWLYKFDAVTRVKSVSSFYALCPPMTGRQPGDPMLAYVNGRIDISSAYITDPTKINPWASFPTHHQLFTTDLKHVDEKVLSKTLHGNGGSMVIVGDTINFISGTAIMGDLIVMQYRGWKYVRTIPLRKNSGCPDGMVFDGKRFYVSYLDITGTSYPALNNVRLAAFDVNWNMLDDIAVTSFTTADNKQASRPSLALWGSRLYVCWDQDEDTASGADLDHANIQAYVAVYDVK